MAHDSDRNENKSTSGKHKEQTPDRKGGDQIRKTQEWGGGSKGSKGGVTESDRKNPNSSSKS